MKVTLSISAWSIYLLDFLFSWNFTSFKISLQSHFSPPPTHKLFWLDNELLKEASFREDWKSRKGTDHADFDGTALSRSEMSFILFWFWPTPHLTTRQKCLSLSGFENERAFLTCTLLSQNNVNLVFFELGVEKYFCMGYIRLGLLLVCGKIWMEYVMIPSKLRINWLIKIRNFQSSEAYNSLSSVQSTGFLIFTTLSLDLSAENASQRFSTRK